MHFWKKVVSIIVFEPPTNPQVSTQYIKGNGNLILDITDETFIHVRNVDIEANEADFTQVCGFDYQPNPDTDPGKLVVQFDAGNPPWDYWILGTDYDNYACVYDCFEFNDSVGLFAWVLTRDPNPSLETLEQCLDIFIANGVEVADFIPFPQENCDYDVIDSHSCEI